MPTTILVEPDTRARLKQFGTHGMTYDDILNRLMDQVEKDAFFADLKRRLTSSDPKTWVSLDDLDENFEPKVRAGRARRASKASADRKTASSRRAPGVRRRPSK